MCFSAVCRGVLQCVAVCCSEQISTCCARPLQLAPHWGYQSAPQAARGCCWEKFSKVSSRLNWACKRIRDLTFENSSANLRLTVSRDTYAYIFISRVHLLGVYIYFIHIRIHIHVCFTRYAYTHISIDLVIHTHIYWLRAYIYFACIFNSYTYTYTSMYVSRHTHIHTYILISLWIHIYILISRIHLFCVYIYFVHILIYLHLCFAKHTCTRMYIDLDCVYLFFLKSIYIFVCVYYTYIYIYIYMYFSRDTRMHT